MTLPTPPPYGNSAAAAAPFAPPHPAAVPYRPRDRKNYRVEHASEYSLTVTEVDRLLTTVTDTRDLALLTLAISTGMRREDIVAIELTGYDAAKGLITYYEKKKRKTRTTGIGPRAQQAINLYLSSRGRESRWLFPAMIAKSRGHLSGRTAWNILQFWLDKSGLVRRPFHSLRGTCYKLAKARGWSVEQAAALIGDTIRVAMEFYGVATAGEINELHREKPLL